MTQSSSVIKKKLWKTTIHGVHYKMCNIGMTFLFNCENIVVKIIFAQGVYIPTYIRQSAWWTMDGGSSHCTGDRDQNLPMEKKCKKAKWLSEEALQIAVKEQQKAKEKRKDISIWM